MIGKSNNNRLLKLLPRTETETEYLQILEREKEGDEQILVIPLSNRSKTNSQIQLSTEPLGDLDYLQPGESVKIIALFKIQTDIEIEIGDHFFVVSFGRQRGAIFKNGERILGM